MKVAQLIEALQKLPQDVEIKYLWDGSARSTVKDLWMAQGGYAVLSDYDEVVYYSEDLPINSTLDKNGYSCSKSGPNEE